VSKDRDAPESKTENTPPAPTFSTLVPHFSWPLSHPMPDV
jgi:hypothetical protein